MSYMPSTSTPNSGYDPAGQRYMDAQAIKAASEARKADADAEKRRAEARKADAEAEKRYAEAAEKRAAHAREEAARRAEESQRLSKEFVALKQELEQATSAEVRRDLLVRMTSHSTYSQDFLLDLIYRGNLDPQMKLGLLRHLNDYPRVSQRSFRLLPSAITEYTEQLSAFQGSDANPRSTTMQEFKERIDKLFQENSVQTKARKNVKAQRKLYEGLDSILSEMDVSPRLRHPERARLAGQALQHFVDRDVRWFDMNHDVTIKTFFKRHNFRPQFSRVIGKLLSHI